MRMIIVVGMSAPMQYTRTTTRRARTDTETRTDTRTDVQVRTLRLVRRRVTFADGTVDNEHLGRRKSKCCCKYTIGKDKTKNKYER